jgi:hypothetical protein
MNAITRVLACIPLLRVSWLPARYWYPPLLRVVTVCGPIPRRGPRRGSIYRWAIRIAWIEVYAVNPEFADRQRAAKVEA